MNLCDHIRGDAYECTMGARWSVDIDGSEYFSCNNHLWQFLSRVHTNLVHPAGEKSV